MYGVISTNETNKEDIIGTKGLLETNCISNSEQKRQQISWTVTTQSDYKQLTYHDSSQDKRLESWYSSIKNLLFQVIV